jgi:trehalose 6-phosphate synthase
VNPFAIEEMAEAIHEALNMPAVERRRRMNRCRAAVSANNVYHWAGKIVSTLAGIDLLEPAETDPESRVMANVGAL